MIRSRFLFAALVCALLIAYGSFIPFHWRPIPFDEALRRFLQIPYLALGAQDRADWVANALLYLPLGWLVAAAFSPRADRSCTGCVLALTVALGAVWAVAVEFGQLYFPGRTVSLNDVIAEIIGTFLGAGAWILLAAHWRQWWQRLLGGGHFSARAALVGYGAAYLALALVPFDFVLSAPELAAKLDSDLYGSWIAGVGCRGMPCSLRLGVEAALVVPLGWWWAAREKGGAGGLLSAALIGLALGGAIEGLQLLLISGVSQGASIASRGAGMLIGAWLHAHRDRIAAIDLQRVGRPLVIAATVPYLWAVAYVNRWFTHGWLDPASGIARLDGEQLSLIPFYYQYFTSEANAIRSALIHAALYVPVGVAVWLWSRPRQAAPVWIAPLAAACIAAIAETGKLFIPKHHPDYSDVLFGAGAAWAVAWLLRAISRGVQVASHATVPGESTSSLQTAASPGVRILGATLLATAAWSSLVFPLPLSVLAGLAVYAAVLVRYPTAYLLALPVALGAIDLAPWSGRLFWDEFDFVVLTTLGVRLLMRLPQRQRRLPLPRIALALLAIAVGGSLIVGLLPLQALDAHAFAGYLSPFNAARIAKGYLWGLALLWLMSRDAEGGFDIGGKFAVGCGLALAAIALWVAVERVAFTGLWAFDVDFRVAGPVAAMHVGGAYLDSLLVALLPFTFVLASRAGSLPVRIGWLAVAALGVYAIVVTFSRATLAAWVIGVVVYFLFWTRRRKYLEPARAAWSRARIAGYAGVLTALGVAVAAAMLSPTLRDRFALLGTDVEAREAHWRDTLGMMRFDIVHSMLGMGLGAFPREYYRHADPVNPPAAWRLATDVKGRGPQLELVGGRGLFFGQRIRVDAGAAVDVSIALRGPRADARLFVGLCEATVLYSANCFSRDIAVDAPGQVTLRSPSAAGAAAALRPLVLFVNNGTPGTVVRIESISARDSRGRELLRNGDFAHGTDHWFFTSDDHLAWHPKNAFIYVLFELGVLGSLAWCGVGLAAIRGVFLADPRRATVPAVGAALAALTTVALFDTVIDAPRMIVLVLLVALGPVHQSRSA